MDIVDILRRAYNRQPLTPAEAAFLQTLWSLIINALCAGGAVLGFALAASGKIVYSTLLIAVVVAIVSTFLHGVAAYLRADKTNPTSQLASVAVENIATGIDTRYSDAKGVDPMQNTFTSLPATFIPAYIGPDVPFNTYPGTPTNPAGATAQNTSGITKL